MWALGALNNHSFLAPNYYFFLDNIRGISTLKQDETNHSSFKQLEKFLFQKKVSGKKNHKDMYTTFDYNTFTQRCDRDRRVAPICGYHSHVRVLRLVYVLLLNVVCM